MQTIHKLNDKAARYYRSLVGQLAWPARDTMPQLSYSVSELQQQVDIATIGDFIHSIHVLNIARTAVTE